MWTLPVWHTEFRTEGKKFPLPTSSTSRSAALATVFSADDASHICSFCPGSASLSICFVHMLCFCLEAVSEPLFSPVHATRSRAFRREVSAPSFRITAMIHDDYVLYRICCAFAWISARMTLRRAPPLVVSPAHTAVSSAAIRERSMDSVRAMVSDTYHLARRCFLGGKIHALRRWSSFACISGTFACQHAHCSVCVDARGQTTGNARKAQFHTIRSWLRGVSCALAYCSILALRHRAGPFSFEQIDEAVEHIV